MRPLVASLIATLAACHGGPGPDDPVVILISVDTLRADHVGLYGYERPTTPNIDAFFGKGTVYEQASSGAPCTIPSVRQTLSGGYDLAPQRRRLAEIFQDAGWRTAASTAQHMFLYDAEAGAYDRGFDVFETQGRRELDAYGMSARQADKVVDRGIALLDGWPWDTGPTFLWLHFFDPHDPYEPPHAHRHFDEGNTSTRPDGDRRKYLMNERPDSKWAWMEAGHIFSKEDVQHFVNLYDGEIASVDEELGRFFAHLDKRGLSDRAVVMFTSDHGEWLGEDDAWDHCRTLHQREIHVPMMIRVGDGGLGDAPRVSKAVSTIDVLPTLVARAGLELPEGDYHGEDVATSPDDREVVSMWRSRKIVRDARYKLVLRDDHPVGLFDLSTDPLQTIDVMGQHPDVADRLLLKLAEVPNLEERVAKENEETMDLLKQIGYVDDAEALDGANQATLEEEGSEGKQAGDEGTEAAAP